MKYIVSLSLTGTMCLVMLACFWRAYVLAGRDIAVLTGGVNSLAADWIAKKVPFSRRVVNLVISDAASGLDPYEAVLSQEGLVETASGWISRSLIGGDAALANPTPFAKAFADSTTLVWCHEGFSMVSQERMTREIARAVLRANEVGAEVNIVAQGRSAGPALLALISLEAAERGGVKVGANKMVLVGLSLAELERLSFSAAKGFAKPGNVLEMAAIWAPREGSVMIPMIQILSNSGKGEPVLLRDIWPELGGSVNASQDLGKLVNGLIGKVESLEHIANRQQLALKEAAAKKAAEDAAKKVAEARTAAEEAAQKEVEAKRASEEAARMDLEARRAAAALRGGQRAPPPGAGDRGEREELCAQCCAGVGGSWSNMSDSKAGCCQGGDEKSLWHDNPPCQEARRVWSFCQGGGNFFCGRQ